MKLLRPCLAALLSLIIVALSPGFECYHVLAQTFQDRPAEAGSLSPQDTPANTASVPDLANPTGIRPVSDALHATSLNARPVVSAVKTAAPNAGPLKRLPAAPVPGSQVLGDPAVPGDTPYPSGLPAAAHTPLSRHTESARHAAARISQAEDYASQQAAWNGRTGSARPFSSGGAAFGFGDNFSAERHTEVNGVLQKAFSDSNAKLAYQDASIPNGTVAAASDEARLAVDEALKSIANDHGNRSFRINGLGDFVLNDLLKNVKRVLLVATESAALRFSSVDDFQISHVGFGPDHDTASIYLESRWLKDNSLKFVLINDAIELAFKVKAKAENVPWNEDLAKTAQEEARKVVESLQPGITDYVRGIVQNLFLSAPAIQKSHAVRELEALGFQGEAASPYLTSDLENQQIILNQLAALLAKGFKADEVDPFLLTVQAGIDWILEGIDAAQVPASVIAPIKELRQKFPEEYSRIVMKSTRPFIDAILDGRPVAQKPAPTADSQVSGLAYRLERKLSSQSSDRDVDLLLANYGLPSGYIHAIWSLWSNPTESGQVPVIKGAPRTATTLINDIKDVHRKVLSEQQLKDKERQRLQRLAKHHPIAQTVLKAIKKLGEEKARLRRVKRGIKPAKGPRAERDSIRAQKDAIQLEIDALDRAIDHLKARLDGFYTRIQSDEMIKLSLEIREWKNAQGLSVVGDYLWDPKGSQLDALVISAENHEPEELNPAILESFTKSGISLTGTQVSGRWLKANYKDWYRNGLLAPHSWMGISLWGTSLNGVFEQVPIREIWPWARQLLEEGQSLLAGKNEVAPTLTRMEQARSKIELASSLIAALQLDLNEGQYGAELLRSVLTVEEANQKYTDLEDDNAPGKRKSQRAALLQSIRSLQDVLDQTADKDRRRGLEKFLEAVFVAGHPSYRLGQLGIIGTAPVSEKPAYLVTEEEARARIAAVTKGAQNAANSQEARISAESKFNALLKIVLSNRRFYEDFPEENVPLNRPIRLDRDAFGRPIEVTIRTVKPGGPLNELVLIAPTGPRQYEAVVNEAIFAMDTMASRAVVRALFRYFQYLKLEGVTLNEARELINQELDDYHSNPKLTDRELIDQAIRDYEADIRWQSLDDLRASDAPGAAAVALAQGFSDFVYSPQNNLTDSEIVLAWGAGEDEKSTEALRASAEKMAEVFAANGIRVHLAKRSESSGWMSYSLLQGPYLAGFLVTEQGVQIFGHDRGGFPSSALEEIRTLETYGTSVRRMKLATARLKRLVQDVDWWDNYQASLRNRFRIDDIQRSGIRLDLESRNADGQVLFESLGLLHSAVDTGANAEMLRDIVRQGAGLRLGAIIKGDQLQIIDTDGAPVPAQDLSLLFTSYLLNRGDYKGPVFRTFAQTRLFDRLAQRHGVPLEEVGRDNVKGDEDSLILSPYTPWNDPRSQILLAMEITAKTGKGLGQLTQELRQELLRPEFGGEIHSQRSHLEIPEPIVDLIWKKRNASELSDFFTQRLKAPFTQKLNASASARFTPQGIQITTESDGWIYIKRNAQGLQFYAESPGTDGPARMIQLANDYFASIAKAVGPTRALRWAFVVYSGILLGVVLFIGLTLWNPVIWIHWFRPIINIGSNVIGFIRPSFLGVVGRIFVDYVGRLIPTILGFYVMEWYLYWWFFRWPLWDAKKSPNRPLQALDRSLENIPSLDQAIKDKSKDYFPVGPRKDSSFGIVRPQLQRLSPWKQVLIYIYGVLSWIEEKNYNDRNFTLRQPINAKGRLMMQATFLQPKILALTWWYLLKANLGRLSPIAGMGFPTHMSSRVGIALPEPLPEYVDAEFGWVEDISDVDTIEAMLSLRGRRWGRAAGMQAVENDQAGAKRAKQLFTSMLQGKKVLFLIPQAEEDDGTRVDETDDYGRFLYYAYVQDKFSDRWINVNLFVLATLRQEHLVDISLGPPASYILPFATLQVAAPQITAQNSAYVPWWCLWKPDWWKLLWSGIKTSLGWKPVQETPKAADAVKSIALPPGPTRTAPLPTPSPSLIDAEVRAILKNLGGEIDPSAYLSLSTDFTGPNGELLPKRSGKVIAEKNSTLILSGRGIRTIGDIQIAAGSSLQVETPAEQGNSAKLSIASALVKDGNIKIRVENRATLEIRKGTVFTGNQTIVVPNGSNTVVEMVNGRLEIRSDYQHPKNLLNRLFSRLSQEKNLSSLSNEPAAEGLDFGDLMEWWKRGKENRYERVALPPKSSRRRAGLAAPDEYKATMPPSRLQANEIVARKHRMLSAAALRTLMRTVGTQKRPNQVLLAGLRAYNTARYNRQKETVERLWNRNQSLIERALARTRNKKYRGKKDPAALDEVTFADVRRIVQNLRQSEWSNFWQWKLLRVMPLEAQKAILELRQEQDKLEEIQGSQEEENYTAQLAEQAANIGGITYWGPLLFKALARQADANLVSIVGTGSYLWSTPEEAVMELWKPYEESLNELLGEHRKKQEKLLAKKKIKKAVLYTIEEAKINIERVPKEKWPAEWSALFATFPDSLRKSLLEIPSRAAAIRKSPLDLDLLVVRSDNAGPRQVDPNSLVGWSSIPLPALRQIKIIEVGEGWLKNHRLGADRLLTRYTTLGVTLWGRDLIGLPRNLDAKVPWRNLLALAQELVSEAASFPPSEDVLVREQLLLADLVLLSAGPAVTEKLKRSELFGPNALSLAQLLRRVRANQRQVEQWVLKEELQAKIVSSNDRIAAQKSSGGVAGLIMGDFTQGRPWHLLNAEESIDFVRNLSNVGKPVNNSQQKLDAAFKRAKDQKAWWDWLPPSRLEVDHFASLGTGPSGRPVKVRVTIRNLTSNEPTTNRFVAYALARIPAPDRVVDEDQYELVMDDISPWNPKAQDLIIRDIAAQLHGLLEAKPLNASLASSDDLSKVAEAIQQFRDGIRYQTLPDRTAVPWLGHGWVGSLDLDDAARVAQGVTSYVQNNSALGHSGVLVAYAANIDFSLQRKILEVLAGNGIESGVIANQHTLQAMTHTLAHTSYDLGLWIAADGIKIIGKDGSPLDERGMNAIGFDILRSKYARTLDLNLAHERKLVNAIQVEAPVAPAPAETSAVPPTIALSGSLPGVSPKGKTKIAAEGSNAEGLNAAVAQQSGKRISLLSTWTIPKALLLHSAVIFLTLGLGVVTAFSHTSPLDIVAFMIAKSMMFFRSWFTPTALIIAWLSSGVRAVIFYFLGDKLKYWMTPEGTSDYIKLPWYKRIFLKKSPLEEEFEALPQANKAATRGKDFSHTEVQKNGIIAVRGSNLSSAKPTLRLSTYLFSVTKDLILNDKLMSFFVKIGEDMVIARYRIARVTFFFVIFPFWYLRVWKENFLLFVRWLARRPLSLLHRVTGDIPERTLEIPADARSRFGTPELVRVLTVKDHNTVRLEDGRTVRVINAGKPGHGAVDLVKLKTKIFFEGRSFWMLPPAAREGGTRNEAVHLYAAEGLFFDEHPVNAVDLAAARSARYAFSNADPFQYVWIDKDVLPMVLTTHLVKPESQSRIARWTGTLSTASILSLAALFVASVVFFVLFQQPYLSPLAHEIGWAALAGTGLFSFVGIYRTIRHKNPTGLVRRPLRGLVAAIILAIYTARLVSPGVGWTQSPAAQNLADHTISVLDVLRDPKLTAGPVSLEQRYPPIVLKNTDSFVQDAREAGMPALTAAINPLHQLSISAPTMQAYQRRLASGESTQGLRAVVSLMAYYANQDWLPSRFQDHLLQTLLEVKGDEYAEWMKTQLAPIIRRSLVEKNIPVPHSSSSWEKIPYDELLSLTVSDNGIAPPGAGESEDNPPSWSPIDLTQQRPSTIIDASVVAGEAATSPLRSLDVNPALAGRYAQRFSTPGSVSKSFQAGVALLAHAARQGFVEPADENDLFSSLLDVSNGDYSGWISVNFVPALKKTLLAKRVPAPGGASWTNLSDREVLKWTAIGLSAYVNDSEVFPAAEQVSVIDSILERQHVDQNDLNTFIQGLAYSRVLLRMPPHIRNFLPETFIHDGHGALLAPLEAAAHHNTFTTKENRFPVVVFWQSYDYDDAPELILGGTHEYVGLVYNLAFEALKEPALKDAVVRDLEKIIPEDIPQGSNLTEQSRRQLLLGYIRDQNPIMTIKLLTPAEQLRLALAIVDSPEAEKLKTHAKIKELMISITSRGTSLSDFQKETVAYLQERGPEPAFPDLPRQRQAQEIQAARELRTNMLVVLAYAMAKEGIPAAQAPFLLPKAAEFLKSRVGATGIFTVSDLSQEAITKTLYQMRANKAMLWLNEFGPEGVRDGDPLAWGLGLRKLDDVRFDAELVKQAKGNLRRPKELVVTFPVDNEYALRSYKHGTFRVTHDDHDDNYYSQFAKGDRFMIMLTNKGSRRKFAEAQIDSIRPTTIEGLTFDELKTEVDFNSTWSIFGEQTAREKITGELIRGLQSYYGPDVNRNSEGYMIVFHILPPRGK